MSRYKYQFKRGDEVIESTGLNLFNGAENAGLVILRCDRLSRFYLAQTKFEDRVRNVWAVKFGQHTNGNIGDLYQVSQNYNL